MAANDPWVEQASQQEIKQKLVEKINELKIRQQRQLSQEQRSSETEGDGWPTLPPDARSSEDGGGSSWGTTSRQASVGNANSSRPAAVGGIGRGRGFKLRESGEQGPDVSSFAALGIGSGAVNTGGNSNAFGQFGGFAGAGSQQSVNNQTAQNKGVSSSTGANFSFKMPVEDSGFKSSSSGSSFGAFPSTGETHGAGNNNWPRLNNEPKDLTTQSASDGWPKLDNFTDQHRNSGTDQNVEAASAHSFGGGTAIVGRLPEENWDEENEKAIDKTEISYLNKILHDKLVNTTYDVEIQRKNPNNPLFSVKSFDELRLSDELLKGVYEMGFTYPSKIQESALPALLADPPQNMIAQSQSGTGKTAAFVLTMLSRVDTTLQYPQCLCLSPTYELAIQIGKVAEKMGKYLKDLQVAYAVRGGFRVSRGTKLTQQIIIGTPGTLLDWILKFRCFDPNLISVFVLDEADLMIGMQGHQDQSIRIHKLLSDSCQHLLFSATYDDEVMDFAYKIISDPVVIRLRREEETLDYIKQFYVNCGSRDDKYRALCNIYGTLTIGQAIIFCRTKKEASWLAGQMSEDGHLVGLLSGELEIEQRAAIIERFKKGTEKVLISTNLTARGIDVQQVTIVINYDVPTTKDGQPDFEAYLHRIGRSGRFGKAGIAINFIDSNWSKSVLEQIEAHFGKKIMPLNADDIEALERIENGE